LTTATRHLEFAYPAFTQSVGVHQSRGVGHRFVGMPGSEVCDLQLTVEHAWRRYSEELRDRLDAASTPGVMLALLEEELAGARPVHKTRLLLEQLVGRWSPPDRTANC